MQEVDDLITAGMRINNENGEITFPGGLAVHRGMTLDEFLKIYPSLKAAEHTPYDCYERFRVKTDKIEVKFYFYNRVLDGITFFIRNDTPADASNSC
ncbi:MAG: hypothetical protein AB7U41_00445 [Dongiaceae bacterium]